MWKFVILTCFVATVGENTQCKEMLRYRISIFKSQGHELDPDGPEPSCMSGSSFEFFRFRWLVCEPKGEPEIGHALKLGNGERQGFGKTTVCRPLQSSLDARARIQIIAQGVADEVEAQHGEHDRQRREDDQMRSFEKIRTAVVEHGSPTGGGRRN